MVADFSIEMINDSIATSRETAVRSATVGSVEVEGTIITFLSGIGNCVTTSR